jgi:hypothetical protein
MNNPARPDAAARSGMAALGAFIQQSLAGKALLVAVIATQYVLFLSKFAVEYSTAINGDGSTFYAASLATFSARLSPYDPRTLALMVNQPVWPYLYPPPSLLAFYPLSLLSHRQGLLAMLVFNHAMIVVAGWLLLFRLLRLSWRRDFLTVGLSIGYLLIFNPFIYLLYHSQMGVILLALLLGFWILARRQATALAGLMLALAIVLKTYPLVIVPLLLISKRYRLVAVALAWLGAIMLLAGLALPPAAWRDWAVHILPTGGYGQSPAGLFLPVADENLNLNGFFASMYTPDEAGAYWPFQIPAGLARALTYAGAGLLIAISALAIRKAAARDATASLNRVMLVALPLIHLIAPFSWYHHLVHLLPCLFVWMLSPAPAGARSPWPYRIMVGGLFMVLAIRELTPLMLLAVLLLWGLAIRAAIDSEVRLSIDPEPAGQPATLPPASLQSA